MKTDWPYVAKVNGVSFLLIPKCGSQTLIDAAVGSGKVLGLKVERCREPEGFTVGFVRHPEGRFLSMWSWFSRMGSFKRVDYSLPQHEFLDLIQTSDDEHFVPQSYYVQSPDFLGRVESFPHDWERLRKIHSWLGTLGHNNKSQESELVKGISDRLKGIYSEDYILYDKASQVR